MQFKHSSKVPLLHQVGTEFFELQRKCLHEGCHSKLWW